MDFSYPKHEKLKSKTVIDLLFSKGKSVAVHPLRLVYVESEEANEPKIKIGVSVSKKYFKKAVDRNYYKRILREVYRLNKNIFTENLNKSYAMMLFYQTREQHNYQDINEKTVALFEKFITQIQEKK
jgi:ribonuclease P protein component